MWMEVFACSLALSVYLLAGLPIDVPAVELLVKISPLIVLGAWYYKNHVLHAYGTPRRNEEEKKKS